MELTQAGIMTEHTHTPMEIDNYIATSQILDQWVGSEWPSSYFIPLIHKNLLAGIESYKQKGIMTRNPGEVRKEDIRVTGEPENFYVRGTDAESILRMYFDDLDLILRNQPENAQGNLGEVVHNAAWAYYAFERIHPYLDGNGRTGRLILNRILKGSGLDEIVFLDTWLSQERKIHLDSMNMVDREGNLLPLELYLLNSLSTNHNNQYLKEELNTLMSQKEQEFLKPNSSTNLGNIWLPFSKIDIYDPSSKDTRQSNKPKSFIAA